MRFILIHCTGGDPNETFFPWLREKLEAKGHEVIAPRFPTPEGQTLENWMQVFQPYFAKLTPDTVLIGRSIGAPFVLRILEKSHVKVKAAFIIAGFASDLHLEEFAPLVNSFIFPKWNWEKIKNNAGRFFIYNSDDDPYVKPANGEEIAQKVGAKMRLFAKRGHFWDEEFPELWEDVKTLI
ncbi:MAG: alpha/beta hydrolase [Candidatus Micrarchaeota archaeon]